MATDDSLETRSIKQKEKENLEFYNFYGFKRFENIFIDGVDENKINKSIIDVTKNDIFLNQISKNGRSFDAALLIKKDKISGNLYFTKGCLKSQILLIFSWHISKNQSPPPK